MGKVFGGAKSPDTSGYDRQLEEQRKATEKAEAEAARLKADQDAAEERRKQGRGSLIKTSAGGDMDTSSVKRKSLLGG